MDFFPLYVDKKFLYYPKITFVMFSHHHTIDYGDSYFDRLFSQSPIHTLGSFGWALQWQPQIRNCTTDTSPTTIYNKFISPKKHKFSPPYATSPD